MWKPKHRGIQQPSYCPTLFGKLLDDFVPDNMRRNCAFLLLLILILVSAACDLGGEKKKQKREAAYQAARQSYSDVMKPGMTRKDVEEYFRTKAVVFSQLCCIEAGNTYADLIKIGKEKHPWYCEAHNVYVAFQFAAAEPRDNPPSTRDSDILKKVTVFHKLEGCL
jgi:hypothetical protein